METSSAKDKGLQAGLSEPSPSLLPGKTEGREVGDVDATGIIPVCGNRSKQHEQCEPRRATDRIAKEGEVFLGTRKWAFAASPSAAISRETWTQDSLTSSGR